MRMFVLGLLGLNVLFLLVQWASDEPEADAVAVADKGVEKLVLVTEALEAKKVKTDKAESAKQSQAADNKPVGKTPASSRVEQQTAAKPTANNKVKARPAPAKKTPQVVKAESLKLPDTAKASASPSEHCYRLGVFVERKEANLALTGLQALDYSVKLDIIYPENGKYLVYLQSFDTIEEARKVTANLKAKGIRDFQILSLQGQKNGISLGVYRHRETAANRLKQIMALGYAPVLQSVSGKPLKYNINFSKPDKTGLSTEEKGFIIRSFKSVTVKKVKCGS